MPFTGHLLVTYAFGKGPVALVSALGGARPIFVFSLSALGTWLTPGLIFEKFTRPDIALKLVSATMVVAAVVIISTAGGACVVPSPWEGEGKGVVETSPGR
jgi:hypothetical protein